MTKDTKTTDIDNKNAETLSEFVDFLEKNEISINTKFLPDEDTGYITHQMVIIRCGNVGIASNPEQLEFPLQIAPVQPDNVSIN